VLEYGSPPKKQAFAEKGDGAFFASKGDTGANVTVLTNQSKSNAKETLVMRTDTNE
jgi:hypothetical protein